MSYTDFFALNFVGMYFLSFRIAICSPPYRHKKRPPKRSFGYKKEPLSSVLIVGVLHRPFKSMAVIHEIYAAYLADSDFTFAGGVVGKELVNRAVVGWLAGSVVVVACKDYLITES